MGGAGRKSGENGVAGAQQKKEGIGWRQGVGMGGGGGLRGGGGVECDVEFGVGVLAAAD